MTEPIVPQPIPEGVRLEAGMLLARRERATEKRPERRKLVVLVRPRTVLKPVSVFDQRPDRPMQDVTEWIIVRMATNPAYSAPDSLVGGGTFLTLKERTVRVMFRYVGFLGEVRAPIDWNSI